MGHPYPRKQKTFIKNNCLLEVFTGHLVFFAVEIVSPHREPTYRMRRIVFHQIVSAVVQLSCHTQIQQTCRIDGQNLETERVLFDSFYAEFIGGWDSVVLVQGFGLDAQDVDILFRHQTLEDVVPPDILPHWRYVAFLDILDLRLKNLPEPLVLRCKSKTVQQPDLLIAGDELAVDQPIESLNIRGIFLHAFLVIFDSLQFIFLGLVALSSDKGPARFHLPVAVGVMQLHLQICQTKFVLLVHQQSPGHQQLKTYVFVDEFMLLEQGMHLLKVTVPEIAFPQQIHSRNMKIGQTHQFISKKDGIGIVMHVQVVDSEVVQPPQHLVGQHLGGKGVQLREVVLGVGPVVGLQQFGEEEHPVGFGGGEDGRFAPAHLNLYLNCKPLYLQLWDVRSRINPQPHADPQECSRHRHRQRLGRHHPLHLHLRAQGIRQRPRQTYPAARDKGQKYSEGPRLPKRPQIHETENNQILGFDSPRQLVHPHRRPGPKKRIKNGG